MIDDDREQPTRSAHVFEALDAVLRRAGAHMTKLAPSDIEGLRGSHGRILDLIASEGSRPSSLTAGAWITKQAVGQRIRELEERGLVSVTSDPSDGRALIVQRTAEGDRLQRSVVRAIADLEAAWAEQVGSDRYETFRQVLDELASG